MTAQSKELTVIDPGSMVAPKPRMELAEMKGYAKIFRESGLTGPDTEAQLVVKILAGQAFGMDVFTSVNSFEIIKGRIGMKPVAMASEVRKTRGRYDFDVTYLEDDGCRITFYMNGKPRGEHSFMRKDAIAAGLAGGENYRKYPRDMYFSRCISGGVKKYCPDILAGNIYTVEEVQDFEAAPVHQQELPSVPRQAPSVHQPGEEPSLPEEEQADAQPQPVELPQNWRQRFTDATERLHMPWKSITPDERKAWLKALLFGEDEEVPVQFSHRQWREAAWALEAYIEAAESNPPRLSLPYIAFLCQRQFAWRPETIRELSAATWHALTQLITDADAQGQPIAMPPVLVGPEEGE